MGGSEEFSCLHSITLFILAILIIITASNTFQILVYQALTPRLVWSIDSLKLNVTANRDAWRACKRFNWCSERKAPYWPPVWRGEVRWLA